MGLKSLLEAGVNSAFNTISGSDNLAETVTYKSVGASTYDPNTGSVQTVTTDVVLSRVVLYEFEEKEVDNDVVVLTDMKMVFPTKDIGNIVPKSADKFVDSKGRTWEVVQLMGVPANLIYILHVRSSM